MHALQCTSAQSRWRHPQLRVVTVSMSACEMVKSKRSMLLAIRAGETDFETTCGAARMMAVVTTVVVRQVMPVVTVVVVDQMAVATVTVVVVVRGGCVCRCGRSVTCGSRRRGTTCG